MTEIEYINENKGKVPLARLDWAVPGVEYRTDALNVPTPISINPEDSEHLKKVIEDVAYQVRGEKEYASNKLDYNPNFNLNQLRRECSSYEPYQVLSDILRSIADVKGRERKTKEVFSLINEIKTHEGFSKYLSVRKAMTIIRRLKTGLQPGDNYYLQILDNMKKEAEVIESEKNASMLKELMINDKEREHDNRVFLKARSKIDEIYRGAVSIDEDKFDSVKKAYKRNKELFSEHDEEHKAFSIAKAYMGDKELKRQVYQNMVLGIKEPNLPSFTRIYNLLKYTPKLEDEKALEEIITRKVIVPFINLDIKKEIMNRDVKEVYEEIISEFVENNKGVYRSLARETFPCLESLGLELKPCEYGRNLYLEVRQKLMQKLFMDNVSKFGLEQGMNLSYNILKNKIMQEPLIKKDKFDRKVKEIGLDKAIQLYARVFADRVAGEEFKESEEKRKTLEAEEAKNLLENIIQDFELAPNFGDYFEKYMPEIVKALTRGSEYQEKVKAVYEFMSRKLMQEAKSLYVNNEQLKFYAKIIKEELGTVPNFSTLSTIKDLILNSGTESAPEHGIEINVERGDKEIMRVAKEMGINLSPYDSDMISLSVATLMSGNPEAIKKAIQEHVNDKNKENEAQEDVMKLLEDF